VNDLTVHDAVYLQLVVTIILIITSRKSIAIPFVSALMTELISPKIIPLPEAALILYVVKYFRSLTSKTFVRSSSGMYISTDWRMDVRTSLIWFKTFILIKCCCPVEFGGVIIRLRLLEDLFTNTILGGLKITKI